MVVEPRDIPTLESQSCEFCLLCDVLTAGVDRGRTS